MHSRTARELPEFQCGIMVIASMILPLLILTHSLNPSESYSEWILPQIVANKILNASAWSLIALILYPAVGAFFSKLCFAYQRLALGEPQNSEDDVAIGRAAIWPIALVYTIAVYTPIFIIRRTNR